MDVILDLGSGAATTLWYLCQYYNCKGIGIEYATERLHAAADKTVKLLELHGKNEAFNPNLCNTLGNILNLTELPPCTVLYLYDEAFPPEVMEKIIDLVDVAPSTLRYIISFKGNKCPEWKGCFTDLKNVTAVALQGVSIKKRFSGEGSRFDVSGKTNKKQYK